jgi:hypothetical protein
MLEAVFPDNGLESAETFQTRRHLLTRPNDLLIRYKSAIFPAST